MQTQEPPSCTSTNSPLFFIGKDSHGHWVAQDEQHLRGGLFVNRDQAMRFALFENGHHPEAVVMVADVFELDMTAKAPASHHAGFGAELSPYRRAA
jgi:hypothetical protein